VVIKLLFVVIKLLFVVIKLLLVVICGYFVLSIKNIVQSYLFKLIMKEFRSKKCIFAPNNLGE